MRDAQMIADTGEPVLISGLTGSYTLPARKDAVTEALAGVEFATAMDEAQP